MPISEPSPPSREPAATPARRLGFFRRLHERIRGLGLVGFYAVFASTFPLVGTAVLGGVIVANEKGIDRWVAAHPVLAPVTYCLAFLVLAGLAILPTTTLSLAGAWFLGFAGAFPAALIGYMGAAVLGYEMSRRAAGDRVVELLLRKPKWQRIYTALLAAEGWRTVLLIVLLRLPPTFPFAPMNVLFAAVGIRRRTFLLGSFLGMAPRTAVVIYLWSGIAHLAVRKPLDIQGGMRDTRLLIGSVAASAAALVIISVLVHQALHRLTGGGKDTGAAGG